MMKPRRPLPIFFLGCLTLATAAVAVTPSSPAFASQHGSTPPSGTLTVTPEQELFNVTLRPGDTVRASAQVENFSHAHLELVITPIVASQNGLGDGAEALFISTLRTSDCTAEKMVQAQTTVVRLDTAKPLFQGTIFAGSTAEVCVQVSYPVSIADTGTAVSVIDFVFTGVERNSESPTAPTLAQTGEASLTRLFPLAAGIGLLVTGSASLLRYSRRFDTVKET